MQKRRVLGGPAELRGAGGRQKGAQDSPDHVDVNRRPQIVKVEKTSSLWGASQSIFVAIDVPFFLFLFLCCFFDVVFYFPSDPLGVDF